MTSIFAGRSDRMIASAALVLAAGLVTLGRHLGAALRQRLPGGLSYRLVTLEIHESMATDR